MPAPTTYQAPPEPDFDLLVKVEINREGVYPWIACIFRAVSDLSPASNALGKTLYESRGGEYTLFLDSRNPLALGKIATLMSQAGARVVAEEDLDSAIANEAYDLLAECVAIGNTADILSTLGVEVRGANPFPAS